MAKGAGSYWGGNGKYQALSDKMQDLIPDEGPCPDARGKNARLEKLRVAANCYYDLYNNGLCNRAAEFRRVFGFGGSRIVKSNYRESTDSVLLESIMDKIVLAAAAEQGIPNPAANAECIAIMRSYQSTLGASHKQCDTNGQVMWDRIDAAIEQLSA